MEKIISRELYRLSLFADLVPVLPKHEPLRIFHSSPFHIEVVEEDVKR